MCLPYSRVSLERLVFVSINGFVSLHLLELSSSPFPGIRLLLHRLSTEIGVPWLQLSMDCLLSTTPPTSDRDRQTDRQRHTERDRDKDRQRQTDRLAGRQTDRQIDRDRERPRETETKTDRQTEAQRQRQRQRDRQIGRQTGRQTERERERPRQRQTDRQTESERDCYCCVLKRPKHVKVFGLESPWHPTGTMAPSP